MPDRDEYVSVKGRARTIKSTAVLFAVGETVSRAAWIPRSLVHGADDKRLDEMAARVNGRRDGEAMTLRMFRWKAEEVGFDGERDDRTHDLFRGTEP